MFLFYLGFCRRLKFTTPVDGFALEGHVIKNISLSIGMRSSCRGRCTIESKCISINIGPPIKDQVICQLSDSDHTLHPEDLKPQEGFTYSGTEVRNSNSAGGSKMLFFRLHHHHHLYLNHNLNHNSFQIVLSVTRKR